jgi:hypothetical protein
VQDLEKSIDDDVMAALQNDNSDIVDILDEPDEELVDANDDNDTVTVLADDINLAAAIDTSIPESVDLNTLSQVAGELETAAVTNTISIPTTVPLETIQEESMGALEECNAMANAIGQSAGMDTDKLFSDINLLEQNDAHEIRNVRRRQAQGQQACKIGPAFNDEMLQKWLELWSDGTNPSDGKISFKDWYKEKAKEYRLWMYKQLMDAEENNISPRPQLFDVTFEATKAWVDEMKKVANSTLQAGAVNHESAVLGQQFESILNLTTAADNVEPFSSEGGIGVGTNRSDLRLTVRATSSIQENSFVPPTSDVVLEVMPTKRQKKARKAVVVDAELERRKEKAKSMMAQHNISPDAVDGKKKRCSVCHKYLSFEFQGAKHLKINVKFCPLADDRSIFDAHMQEQKSQRKVRNDRHQEKKRLRDESNM